MSSFNGFNNLPSGATRKAEAFQLRVPDKELDEFKTLLKLSPIAPETWENKTSTKHEGQNFGITRDWLLNAKETWLEKFDWRAHEAHINSFPNFKIPIKNDDNETMSVHFTALFSTKVHATPVIFMHGWPGSFLEFLPMLDLLRTKYSADTLPFHAIVPSLPGYGLSSGPPLDHDYAPVDAASTLHHLMIELGFGTGYVAQGGDVGARLARRMSFVYDECKALHLNFLADMEEDLTSNRDELTEAEVQHLERGKKWGTYGIAYAMENATRPATVGLMLSASPVALLCWVGEKLLEWSDSDCISLDEILRLTSLYWFTSTIPRCVYPYRHWLFGEGHSPLSTTKPLGYSAFKDLSVLPNAWGKKKYPNLVFRKDHDKGGHFAALEAPETFLEDIEEFVKLLESLS